VTLPITISTTIEEKKRTACIALLPIGAFEQHGPCLPLTTDTLIASAIAHEIAQSYDVMLLPPITFSCSHEHSNWSGTVSLRHSTLSLIIDDIAISLRNSDVDKIVLINAHGGNYVLGNIVQQANAQRPKTMALFPRARDWRAAREAAELVTSDHDDMHAGEIETSILLYTQPDVVQDGWQELDHKSERPFLHIHGMAPYTETGVIGAPSYATPEKGQAVLASLKASFAETLNELQSFP
jgi:creatinine amidohydrolase